MANSTGGETSPSATSTQLISTHKRKQIKKRKKKGMKRSSIGSSTSSTHSSTATTHISLSSLKDADQFLKSPRFSPIPKYDRYFRGRKSFLEL